MDDLGRLRRLTPWAAAASAITIVVLMAYYQVRLGQDVLGDLRAVPLQTWALALTLHLGLHLAWGLRLRVLSGAVGRPLPYFSSQAAATSGAFAAAVTPGRVGGEPWRITVFARSGLGAAGGSRLVLADRASDMVFFLAGGILAVGVLPTVFGDAGVRVRTFAFIALVGLLLMALLIAWILVRPGPLPRLASRAANAFDRLRRREPKDRTDAIAGFFGEVRQGMHDLVRSGRRRIVLTILLTIALWTCQFTVLYVVLDGFGFTLPYAAVFVAGLLVTMIASVPAAPGGAGLAELAALVLLTALACGAERCLSPAFLVVWRAMTLYFDLLVGGIVASKVAARGFRVRA